MPKSSSFRFDLGEKSQIIAEVFEHFIQNSTTQQTMCAKASEYLQFVTWDRCVEEWRRLIIE